MEIYKSAQNEQIYANAKQRVHMNGRAHINIHFALFNLGGFVVVVFVVVVVVVALLSRSGSPRFCTCLFEYTS